MCIRDRAGDNPNGRYARTMRVGAGITAAVCIALVLGWLSVPFAIAFMSLAGALPSFILKPAVTPSPAALPEGLADQ